MGANFDRIISTIEVGSHLFEMKKDLFVFIF